MLFGIRQYCEDDSGLKISGPAVLKVQSCTGEVEYIERSGGCITLQGRSQGGWQGVFFPNTSVT